MKHVLTIVVLATFIGACSSDDAVDQMMDKDADPNNPESFEMALLAEQSFGTNSDDFAIGSLQTANGNLVIAGEQDSNAFLMGFDGDLNLLWNSTFSIPNADVTSLSAIAEASNGDFIASGLIITDALGSNIELFVVRTDATGNLLWQRTYGADTAYDAGNITITQTKEGNFLIANNITTTSNLVQNTKGGLDILALVLDPNGEVLSSTTYGGSGGDTISEVIVEPNGTFLFLGSSNSDDGDVTNTTDSFLPWVFRTDNTGAILEQKTLELTGSGFGKSIISLPDGTFAIASIIRKDPADFGATDIKIIVIDSNLNPLDRWDFGGPGRDDAVQIRIFPNGNILLIGNSEEVGGTITENRGSSDFWALILDPNFELLDSFSLGSSGFDSVIGSALLSDNAFLMAGCSEFADGDVNSNNGGTDIWLAKVSTKN